MTHNHIYYAGVKGNVDLCCFWYSKERRLPVLLQKKPAREVHTASARDLRCELRLGDSSSMQLKVMTAEVIRYEACNTNSAQKRLHE